MTAQTPAYLKTRFENGDVPVAADYEDTFDSYLNVSTTAEQALLGNLRTTGQFIGNVSAASITTSAFSFTTLSGTTVSASNIYGSTANIATVSANNINANTVSAATASIDVLKVITASANNIYVASAMFYTALDVSAVATTQAGAFLVDRPSTFVIFADGANNAVILPSSTRGRIQHIINASSTTIKIFPAVSGRFLVTAVNASLSILADKVAIIFHQGNDRYGIQVG